MLGPRIAGRDGIALAPSTLDDFKLYPRWAAQPEITYFWGPRAGNWIDAVTEERFREAAKNARQIHWSIQLDGRTIGFTGIDDIDWIRRQGESYIIIGEAGLHGRGIASEVVRLRTRFAFRELNLHRIYNYIVYDNVGSRRANEKAGYHEQGRFPQVFRRGPRRHDDWLGEILRTDWEREQATDESGSDPSHRVGTEERPRDPLRK
jgi:RimJ/RimL family protein N-acetyltransferase